MWGNMIPWTALLHGLAFATLLCTLQFAFFHKRLSSRSFVRNNLAHPLMFLIAFVLWTLFAPDTGIYPLHLIN